MGNGNTEIPMELKVGQKFFVKKFKFSNVLEIVTERTEEDDCFYYEIVVTEDNVLGITKSMYGNLNEQLIMAEDSVLVESMERLRHSINTPSMGTGIHHVIASSPREVVYVDEF